MTTTRLVGTSPNQNPVNSDLGDLAFQDKGSVQFTDGSGALSDLSLNPIYKEISESAYAVFVYDTRKDSDGGAWRYRTQDTSWYNEILNTNIRGARREFPSVAVIVSTQNAVTIYDADDSSLPMWISIGGTGRFVQDGYAHAAGPVKALNGKIVVGLYQQGTGSSGELGLYGGAVIFDLIKDQSTKVGGRQAGATSSNGGTRPGLREISVADWYAVGGAPFAIGGTVYDVAMTVLPGAPIDTDTGLPVPTIAFGTISDVSILNNDGVWYRNSLSANGNNGEGSIQSVTFDKNGYLYVGQQHLSGTFGAALRVSKIYPYTSFTVIHGWNGYVSFPLIASYSFGGGGESFKYVDILDNEIATGHRAGVGGAGDTSSANKPGLGLSIISHVEQDQSKSLVANIRTDHNTGWMPGNIYGAWLSDTTQENLITSELITNGSFASNASGWTAGNASLSIVSGRLRVTVSSDGLAYAYQAISTIPGKIYTVTCDIPVTNTTNNFGIRVGTSIGNADLGQDWLSTGATKADLTFRATSSVTYIHLALSYSAGQYADFDNVGCRVGDADRSWRNLGLQGYGTLVKTPVAQGAELVAYSNFSGSNYLYRPRASDVMPTGSNTDFFVGAWFKTSLSGQYNEIFDYAIPGSNVGRLEFLVFQNGQLGLFNVDTTTSGGAVKSGEWTHCVATRRNGLVTVYLNAVVVAQGYNTGTISASADANLYVGVNYNGGNSTSTDQLALLRISGTAPTGDQIYKMYNDEKALFNSNSKATLYGTSNQISGLVYDKDTRLLHVGTSAGRSTFNGLERISNTTVAVSDYKNSISASNGLVAEE